MPAGVVPGKPGPFMTTKLTAALAVLGVATAQANATPIYQPHLAHYD